MFRHFLVPIDGSDLSCVAAREAVALARETRAALTFFFAQVDEASSLYGDGALLRSIEPEVLGQLIDGRIKDVLAKARAIASDAGLDCNAISSVADEPYEAIIVAAESGGCDLIIMASHGYRGVKGLLLGSQTQKVLTHSKIPVLIYR